MGGLHLLMGAESTDSIVEPLVLLKRAGLISHVMVRDHKAPC